MSSPNQTVRRRVRRAVLATGLLAVGLAHAGCGYSLVGSGAFLPEYIRVVAIPTFSNNTARFELEVRVTDAVTREFVSRGNYRVVAGQSGADALLRGELNQFLVTPIGIQNQRATTWQVTIRARVTLTDLVANKVLFTNSNFMFQDQFEFPESSAGRVDIEVGSIDEISREFARVVVSSILEGF